MVARLEVEARRLPHLAQRRRRPPRSSRRARRGRAGWAAPSPTRSSSASTFSSSALPDSIVSFSALDLGDQVLGLLAPLLGLADLLGERLALAPGRSRSRAAARGGARRARAARRRRSAAPRRASACLTRSGSERISFRSSMAVRDRQGDVFAGAGAIPRLRPRRTWRRSGRPPRPLRRPRCSGA